MVRHLYVSLERQMLVKLKQSFQHVCKNTSPQANTNLDFQEHKNVAYIAVLTDFEAQSHCQIYLKF